MTGSERSGPIRVLHVITRMVRGGAQENTLATAVGIHGCGWESRLVTGPALGAEGSLEPECLATGLRLLNITELVREISPRHDLRALARLTALMRAERPHIVHTHTSKAGLLGRLAARCAGVPAVVHTPHGHVFHSYGGRLKTGLYVSLERVAAPLAHRLVALTDSERREHLELGVGRPAQWVTIHSGVHLLPFAAARAQRDRVRRSLGLPPEAIVFGTVARLVPVKGHRHLIEAFAHLRELRAPLHLLLVGDGPLRDELIALACSLSLKVRIAGEPEAETAPLGHAARTRAAAAPTIHFLGLRRDVPALLGAMDMFVLPSLNEGMGRVLVEAMAAGLPSIASRVSGIPDIVLDGATGVLVPPADAVALAGALQLLSSDPVRRRSMSESGRARAEEFSQERMLGKLEALYRSLLRECGIAPLAERPSEPVAVA